MSHLYGIDEPGMAYVNHAAALARDVLALHAADVDRKGRFPEESVQALARGGLLGLCVPVSFGGKGQPPRVFAAVAEELAHGCGSTAMIFVMHVAAAKAIEASTTLADRDGFLTTIAAGEHLTTLALSEKGSRSQFWAPVSKLTATGSGFTTSAQKSWVTSARRANSYVSTAQKPNAGSPLESTLYFVRIPNQAVRVTEPFEGLGLRGNDSAPVTIEGLNIDKGDLVTALGEGARAKLEVVLPWFSIGTAGMSNGLCAAVVEATAKHMSETGFEHTGAKLRDLPQLRARLAEMSARTAQARALLGYTVGELEKPNDFTPLYVLKARLSSIQAAIDVTDLAMKACGGAAFSNHLPVERLFRDARAGWVMAPTADHLQDFIGKALTGLPLF
jgi:alkylation response protein AidB-like acyl-CoA dehydrogenase